MRVLIAVALLLMCGCAKQPSRDWATPTIHGDRASWQTDAGEITCNLQPVIHWTPNGNPVWLAEESRSVECILWKTPPVGYIVSWDGNTASSPVRLSASITQKPITYQLSLEEGDCVQVSWKGEDKTKLVCKEKP